MIKFISFDSFLSFGFYVSTFRLWLSRTANFRHNYWNIIDFNHKKSSFWIFQDTHSSKRRLQTSSLNNFTGMDVNLLEKWILSIQIYNWLYQREMTEQKKKFFLAGNELYRSGSGLYTLVPNLVRYNLELKWNTNVFSEVAARLFES